MKKIKKKIIGIIIAILLLFGEIVYSTYISPYINTQERYVVTLEKCVDGDTAWFMMNGEKIKARFLYIDTPEYTKEKEYMGKEASLFTQQQLENAQKIEVEFNSDGDQYDKYDRALLWVFVDGELLQEKIAEQGYCEKFYDYGYDYKYKSQIIRADERARKNRVGLYQ